MPLPAGYSSTPLARKLGLKSGMTYLLINEPTHYLELFADFPAEVVLLDEPVLTTLDFCHLFVTQRTELETQLAQLKPLLKKDGLIWISWPKGKSKIPTEVNREAIREIGLASGLVDVKVCAVDKDWSALKFVYRLKDR